MSYFKLINGIKDLLDSDSRVKTITEGDIDDLDTYRQNIPTIAHIVVNGGSDLENLNTYNCEVLVLDIISENNNETEDKFKGNDNKQEVYNLTDNIIRRFVLLFKKQAEGKNIFLIGDPLYDRVIDDTTQNRLAGWEVSFTVGVPNNLIDVCEPI